MAIKYNGNSYKPSGIAKVRYNGNDYLRTTPVSLHCTISGLGSSSPSSVVFSDNTIKDWTPEEVTFDGDVFIKFPKMYRKVNSSISSQITGITISNAQIDSSYHIYPCFLDESGNELDYILIGKYLCSSATRASSVNATKVSMTIGDGRTICRQRGTGYQQMDWMIQRMWQDLIIAKMQTINTNSGAGIDVDQLGIKWDKSGNFMDGFVYDSGTWRFSYKPSMYVDSASSSTSGYNSANYSCPSATNGALITKLGYDTSHEFFNYPSAASGTTYTTYYCDQLYAASGNHPVYSSVGVAYAFNGAFYCYASYAWSGTYGVRLCYRPIS